MRSLVYAAVIGLVAATVPHESIAQPAKSATFTSPFAYCAAYGTVDRPGPRYRGPKAPREVLSALTREVPNPMAAMTTWRCDGGVVKACYLGASGRACAKKDLSPTPNPGMVAFCRAHPNAEIDYATMGNTAYEWRCRGRSPLIVSGLPVDSQGYLSGAWVSVQPASTSSAPASIKASGGSSSYAAHTAGEIALTRRIAGTRWYDQGPGCASISKSVMEASVVLRAWYCEADESSARKIVMDYDRTVGMFVHEETGLLMNIDSPRQITLLAKGNISERLGDGFYIAEKARAYIKQ